MNAFRILLATIQNFYNIFAPNEINQGVNFLFIGSSYNDYKNLTSGANFSSLTGTSYFDVSKPTAVMIHGWKSDYLSDDYIGKPFANSYISRGDHNMIFIDWSYWAKNNNIFRSVSVMKQIAAFISKAFKEMETNGFNLEKFHLIGHSLGGQMVGMIGDYFIKNYNVTFYRITGLDPAGVQFFNEGGPPFVKGMPSINKNNARFVDIIHTDADWNGKSESEAHIDFWPNNGTRYQTGCKTECSLGGSCSPCSHERALTYYFESLTYSTPHFIANRCQDGLEFNFPNFNSKTCNQTSKASMGFYADSEPITYGNYYLKTNGDSPYSQ